MSFVEITKYLLSQPKDSDQKLYVLSERISKTILVNKGLEVEGTKTPTYNNASIMLLL